MDESNCETSDDTLRTYPYNVLDLSTGNWYDCFYAATAHEAIIFATAKLKRDDNMFEWAEKYGSLIEEGKVTVTIGNLTCLKKVWELNDE